MLTMSSSYNPNHCRSVTSAVGLEMDMEVKSEPESEDESCESSMSITSSIEEVPTAVFTHYQSDKELEEPEDEPLVEINSVTVPQEVVEVKLQPTLLLFVNKDLTSSDCVRPTEVSNDLPNPTENSIEETSICNETEKELASRKAITRALRNFKRKGKSVRSISSENSNNKKFVNNHVEENVGSFPAEELCSPRPKTSRDTTVSRTSSSLTSASRQNKHKLLSARSKKKTKFKQRNQIKRTKNIANNKKIKKTLQNALDNDLLLSSINKQAERGDDEVHKLDAGKENTQNNREDLSTKDNLLDHQNSLSITAKKLVSKSKKTETNNENRQDMLISKSFGCTVCNKKFRLKSHLATHSRAHIDIRKFKCNECGNLFKTKANLYFHMKTHEEAPFICEKCKKTFPERKILTRHIRVVHRGEGNYNCDQCGRSFKCAANLELHFTLHTGNKPYTCNMCEKSFVYKSTYTMHMKGHDADNRFSCELCPSDTGSKGELRRRCHHHSDSRPWLCTVCGKGYPLKGTLKNHMKSHESDKPYKCNECGKSFMKKQSYECHLKVHSGENPQYMCDQCSQSYYNVFALKRHYMKHTSERKFICDICNKAFWMKDALKVHKRSHANVKMFQCTQCSKSFAHKHTLVAHMRSHSSEQPFVCNICPKTFIYKYNLDRHQQHHSLPSTMQPLPPPVPLPLPPSLIMMAPPKHLERPTLHIL